ncbi:MAG: amidohydrolase family protein [Candidatus Lokiarchaeota archaeon]|nr:amidohydrolase family protein [Candidatus Lokiarchaeota archaeon]
MLKVFIHDVRAEDNIIVTCSVNEMQKESTMTTDIHTHLGSERMSIHNVTEHDLPEQVDILLNRMDTFGIRHAVLTPIEPSISTKLYAEASRINPERIHYACSINPRPLDDAQKLLKEYVNDHTVALVLDDKMYHPEDPSIDKLVDQAIEYELPIYFHSDQMSAATLALVDRLSTIYPTGKFIVLHMGGLFGFPQVLPLITRDNVFCEISVTLVRLVESPLRMFLEAMIQEIGVSKLIFGSEHHSEYPDIMAALNMINLNIESSRLIRQQNAWQLLKLDYC